MPTVKDVVVRKPTAQEKEVCSSWPVWSCEKSVFDWDYTDKESCLILEGKVVVKDRPSGGSISFGKGDLVIFPNGLKCVWEVLEPVRKHYNFG